MSRYSTEQIQNILTNYFMLKDGQLPMVFESTRQSVRSPMETALIWCADVDAAIDTLGAPGTWLSICGDINQKRLRIIVNRHKLSWNQDMICEAFLFDELHKDKDNTVGPQQALKLVYKIRREVNRKR